jgi:hypothetical protein
LEEILYQPIQTKIKGLAPVFLLRLGTPINLGSSFASFGAVLRMKLMPSFEIDRTFFKSFLERTILGDLNFTRDMSTTDAFSEVRKFIDVIPLLDIDLAICAFLPTQSDWLQGIASNLEIHFYGSAHFQIAFAPVDRFGGTRSFMEVREWGLHFELDVSYKITLLDFLLPGASGVISTILDYVEPVLAADVTFTLSVLFEIGKEYVGQGLPEKSTVLFDIIVGATINIRILIAVFKGTFQVGLRYEQTSGPAETAALFLAASDSEFKPAQDVQEVTSIGLYLTLYCSLYLGIDLWFTSIGTDCGGPWEETWQLYADTESEDYGDEAADLPDSDEDGLPDAFEEYLGNGGGVSHGGAALSQAYYLNPDSSDTDGDGLNDKLEIEIFTLPHIADTDGDGLSDGEERLTYLTNPHLPDTDFDNLTDYEECIIYGTNAFFPDTDQDGLRDYFEVTHVWDVSRTKGTFGAVEAVQIGPYIYDDHTDPLNPDTDNDGLVDSEEGYNGIAYANQSIVDSVYYIKEMYVHPLDADTDDDSVRWDYVPEQGFEPSDAFLMDMSDGVEIHGQYVTFIDLEGYPEVKLVKTNPVNPDTDNDTGITLLFNHDGYELSLDPPTDPTDGDTDHDGILDGVEKIGPYGSATNPNDPDTDNDNLPDYEDWVLPTNQRKPDTDEDGVLDGDEVYKYLTSPINNDTDFDGLSDAEELFFFYSNPLIRDSDLDGLSDGEEVLILLTDPLLPDSDGDLLDDGYEVMISHTEPTEWDTDSDGLGDGEELYVYNTNPLDWDTDDDSLALPNATGGMSLPWGDGDEVERGTNPTEMDSDSDGLTDSQELYLAMGAPSFDPIPLDPLNNDTDADGLLDGEEMILENVSVITYPFSGLIITLRYGSCPVKNDTDLDGLNDLEEIRNLCDPSHYDTDGDGLTDYAEVYITLTNPAYNDTDGDELVDGLELNISLYENYTMLSSGFVLSQVSLIGTDARNSDTDGDLLPDGLEIYRQTDPLDDDSDGDGVLDGHEFDHDGDNLTDGEEFYTYKTYLMKLPIAENHTWLAQPGGFDNPDSDADGLSDGTEVKTYGTDPTEGDSDGDGVSDGEEVASGGDPLDPEVFPSPQAADLNWLFIGAGIGGGIFVGLLLGVIIFKFLPGRKISRPKRSKKKKSKATKTSKKTSKKSKKGSDKS